MSQEAKIERVKNGWIVTVNDDETHVFQNINNALLLVAQTVHDYDWDAPEPDAVTVRYEKRKS